MNHTTAQDLISIAAAELAAANIPALVTADTAAALTAAAAGRNVVVITPPAINFHSYHDAEAEWTGYLIAGINDRTAAWTRIDQLLDILREPLDINRATPYDWRPDTGGRPLPAYQVTFTTNHTL